VDEKDVEKYQKKFPRALRARDTPIPLLKSHHTYQPLLVFWVKTKIPPPGTQIPPPGFPFFFFHLII
jgi:hypothetical protein